MFSHYHSDHCIYLSFLEMEEHRFAPWNEEEETRNEAEMLMGKHLCDADRHRSDPDSHRPYLYRPILYAFGASDVTFSYAADYIRIYLLGILVL